MTRFDNVFVAFIEGWIYGGHHSTVPKSSISTLELIVLKIFKKDFIYLFMRHTQREKQRHRQREKQAPCREPDVGLDPGTPGSCPGPKAGAKLLSHPGIP